MLTALPPALPGADSLPAAPAAPQVRLADGRWLSLDGLSRNELHELQWEQEQLFAAAILEFPKGSPERAAAIAHAYDTVCTLLAAQQGDAQPLAMGLDERYIRLVLEFMNRQIRGGIGQPRLFEVGYGSGVLLKEVSENGFRIGGIEVSPAMRDRALALLGQRFADQLLLGDVRQLGKESIHDRPTLIYWNDVFEHICPDELPEYLDKIHQLLIPGGTLLTITPHWLLRPSDVTADFCPPRTEPRGLHFKEYRLAEVSRLLKRAGFRRVATPLFVTHSRVFLFGGGLRRVKQLSEMLLDELPVHYAQLACRGLGMSVTLATK